MKRILVLLASFTVAAMAQTHATVGTGYVSSGRMKDIPEVASYDELWIMDGLLLTDKNGYTQLHLGTDDRQVAHNGFAISWSPDSQRVVIADHSGKAVIIYAAQRENGQWYEAKLTNDDPKRPAPPIGVEKIELLNWLSPTTLQVRNSYQVLLGGDWIWQDHVTTLEFEKDGDLAYLLF